MTHRDDPTVQVVHDALAFVTAAVDGDMLSTMSVATDGLATASSGEWVWPGTFRNQLRSSVAA